MLLYDDGGGDDDDNNYYSHKLNWTNCETVLLPRGNIILALVAGTVLLLFANFPSRFNRRSIIIIQSLEYSSRIARYIF